MNIKETKIIAFTDKKINFLARLQNTIKNSSLEEFSLSEFLDNIHNYEIIMYKK